MISLFKSAGCIRMLFAFGFVLVGGRGLGQSLPTAVLVQSTLDAGGGRSYGRGLAVDTSLGGFSEMQQTTPSELRVQSGYIASLNEPPLRMRSVLGPPNNVSGTIRITDLLRNGSDPEGDPVTISLTGTNTAGGGTVRHVDDTFVYTRQPRLPVNGNDWFTYTMTDVFGGQETGTILLTATSFSGDPLEVRHVPAGMTMTFQGTASILYKLQFQSSLSPGGTWQDFPDWFAPMVDQADGAGTHRFTVETPLRQGFFRTMAVELPSLEPSISRSGNQIAMTFSGAPGIVYKLQSRLSLAAAAEWKDFPSDRQVAAQQAEWDGRVFFKTPAADANAFFRIIPFLPRPPI